MLEKSGKNVLATDAQVAPPEPHEIVIATIDECLRVGNLRWRFIELQRERAAAWGMNSSYRTWLARTAEWFNPERRHYFPPHGFDDAAAVVGASPWLDHWLALESRVSRERRAVREVPHDERRRGRL
jgi:hypothetical protein